MHANNSDIFVTKIGQSNNGLQCVTDQMYCCVYYYYRAGQWFYPNKTRILTSSGVYDNGAGFYRTRGNGSVILNRVNNTTMSPTGLFCCMLPDARGIEQTLCANIG